MFYFWQIFRQNFFFSADTLSEWHRIRPGTPSSSKQSALQLIAELPRFPCGDTDWEKMLLERLREQGASPLGMRGHGHGHGLLACPERQRWVGPVLAVDRTGKSLQCPIALFCGVLHWERPKNSMPMHFYAEGKVGG